MSGTDTLDDWAVRLAAVYSPAVDSRGSRAGPAYSSGKPSPSAFPGQQSRPGCLQRPRGGDEPGADGGPPSLASRPTPCAAPAPCLERLALRVGSEVVLADPVLADDELARSHDAHSPVTRLLLGRVGTTTSSGRTSCRSGVIGLGESLAPRRSLTAVASRELGSLVELLGFAGPALGPAAPLLDPALIGVRRLRGEHRRIVRAAAARPRPGSAAAARSTSGHRARVAGGPGCSPTAATCERRSVRAWPGRTRGSSGFGELDGG